MEIDAVVPARNEASTVTDVVRAALDCEYVREVIGVDDAWPDDPAGRAAAAGAKVVRREIGGSKAHAMADGVAASDAEGILFVDADLIGITAAHLDALCKPFVEGRC